MPPPGLVEPGAALTGRDGRRCQLSPRAVTCHRQPPLTGHAPLELLHPAAAVGAAAQSASIRELMELSAVAWARVTWFGARMSWFGRVQAVDVVPVSYRVSL